MNSQRMEAFSDGVLAIVITIMVLEMHPPKGGTLEDLLHVGPTFLSYVLSFTYVGIYWNNHHHLLKACDRISGGSLWANLHLLFWLSLFPFGANYQGVQNFNGISSMVYGVILLMTAISFTVLTHVLIHVHGEDSTIAKAIGRDRKSSISVLMYAFGTVAAYNYPIFAQAVYAMVAIVWIVPDARIERLTRNLSE